MPYSKNKKAKILIVDDHPIVRQGLAMMINQMPELHACCEASDADIALIAQQNCSHDLAIVDLSLVGTSGLELIKQLRYKFPELLILVMSMHDEILYAERVLRLGAHGYLMKQEATNTLLQAIQVVLSKGLYVSDKMHAIMLQQRIRGLSQDSTLSGLTPTEFEVIHLIGMGLGSNEIAETLNRSVKTIESHKANIKKKLNLKNSNQLMLFAANLLSV